MATCLLLLVTSSQISLWKSGVSQGYGKRLKASGKAYVGKAEFQKFVAEATDETLAKVISRLAILAQTKVYLLWKK
jgi:hypothetical protein